MDTSRWFLRGNSLGASDRTSGFPHNRLIILDFGRPRQSGTTYGVYLPFDQTYTFYSTTAIMNAVKEFARGYWVGTSGNVNNQLRIVVGTNNCCNGDSVSLFQGHGTAWGQMMNMLPSLIVTYSAQVNVVAGSDMEMEFNRPYHTAQWLGSLINVSTCNPTGTGEAGCMYNFGNQTVAVPTTSVGPCNYNDSAATTWAACDVWYISWGAKKSGDPDPFPRPIPEIYHAASPTYPYGYDASQWAALSVYSVNLQQAGPIYFPGTLTQYARCGDICYDGNGQPYANNRPEQGWAYLMDALASNTSTAQFIPWVTDIGLQP
jgi:hypothetical protein